MKTTLLLIITLICIGYVYSASCPTTSCVNTAGGSCGMNDVGSNRAGCGYGLYCSANSNGTCIRQVAAGGTCDSTIFLAQCTNGYYCSSTSNTCVTYKQEAGLPCTSDSQCSAKNDTGDTVDSTCVNGKCAYRAIGQTCVSSTQCGYAADIAFCNRNTGTCQAYPTAGQSCRASNSQCAPNFECDLTDYTCIGFGTVASGGSCSRLEVCQYGLVCGNDDTCVSAKSSGSGVACSNSNQCENNEECVCAAPGAEYKCAAMQPTSANHVKLDNAARECTFSDYSCHMEFDSCSKCENQYCEQIRAGSKNTNFHSCTSSPHFVDLLQRCAPGSTSSAPRSVGSIVLVIGLVLAAVLVL